MDETMRKVEKEKLITMFGSLDEEQIKILLSNIPDKFINKEFKRRVCESENKVKEVYDILGCSTPKNATDNSYIDEIDKIISIKEENDKRLSNINNLFIKKEDTK